MAADRNKVFNELVSVYNNLYPQIAVAAAWKVIKEIRVKTKMNSSTQKRKRESGRTNDVERGKLPMFQVNSVQSMGTPLLESRRESRMVNENL